ncbi:MAG: hypothetical protein J5602_09975 [Clostridia bacterium]|nr:hypothetical protein [Clostridia bacterium]
MNNQTDGRQARAEMEAARAQSEKRFSDSGLPRRYKLYDKIKDHVSLRTIDLVIAITALLIVAALVYGILTANPH